MWTRRELKDKAKGALKANYWRAVLVGLLVVAIAGGIGGFTSVYSMPAGMFGGINSSSNTNIVHVDNDDVTVSLDGDSVHVSVKDDGGRSGDSSAATDGGKAHRTEARDVNVSFAPALALFGLTMLLVGLIVTAISITFYAFIVGPAEVGAQRFFLRNLNKPAEVKEIAFAYDNNYLETVKTIFLRGLFIFLWSLLLVVPGIIKAYEYRMIPYLMAEDPTMTKDRAFAESKRMMTGQKWNAFVLDLSFIGWYILSSFTLGILAIFYVAPYQSLTNAALYEKLRYGMPAPEAQAYDPNAQPGAPAQPWQQAQPYQQAQPWQPDQPVQAPIQQAPVAAAPVASATATAPIESASQPPVPPFAAVGAEAADDAANAAGNENDSAQE